MFNWGDLQKAADDAGFNPVPDNDYDFEVAKAEAKKTSNGKDMIATQLKITSGPYEGRLLFNNFTISPESPAALGFFFRDMETLGLPREYFASNPGIAVVAQTLVGRRGRATVTTREFGGAKRNDVKKITPLVGGPAPAPAPGMMGGAIPSVAVPTVGSPTFPTVAPPIPTVTASAPMAASAPMTPPAPLVTPPMVPGGLGSDDEPPF